MTTDVSLWVWLKGADLVATTAYLTLTEKMGYEASLAALGRFDLFRMGVETGDPGVARDALRRHFATRSTFYNRNKHKYFLEFRGSENTESEGTPLEEAHAGLASEARRRRSGAGKNFDSKTVTNRVMLKNVPIYRTELLVEDLDSMRKSKLSKQLGVVLGDGRIEVSVLGTCWSMAVAAASEEEARRITNEIAITESRHRGLLLNPHNQRSEILSIQTIDAPR